MNWNKIRELKKVKLNDDLIQATIKARGFQALWLKGPDGQSQGKRWPLIVCGKD